MRMGIDADHAQRMQEAYDQVRDLWLANKEHAALVKAIVGNWTSGNCVEYMLPVTASLMTNSEDVLATDCSKFDESDWSHHDDHAAAASFCLRRIMSSLVQWRAELTASELQTLEPDEVDASLRRFVKPCIQIGRFPPG